MTITKDTIIGDILDADFDVAPFFVSIPVSEVLTYADVIPPADGLCPAGIRCRMLL